MHNRVIILSSLCSIECRLNACAKAERLCMGCPRGVLEGVTRGSLQCLLGFTIKETFIFAKVNMRIFKLDIMLEDYHI